MKLSETIESVWLMLCLLCRAERTHNIMLFGDIRVGDEDDGMCDGISRDLRDTKILINENLTETSTAVLNDENSLTSFSSAVRR